MDQRVSFISDQRTGSWTMTELCERYEISRKTGYKWLERYRLEGPSGLDDRSHAARVHGRATPQQIVDAIVAARGAWPAATCQRLSVLVSCDAKAAPAEAAVRQVRSNGEIKWRGDLIHLCSALAGETVAVEETADGQWQVRFFDVPVGIIDQKTSKLRRCASAAPQRTEP